MNIHEAKLRLSEKLELADSKFIEKLITTNSKFARPALRIGGDYYHMKPIKGIVLHWTANYRKGADALANARYFENQRERYCSAHYIVDDKHVVQIIPDNEVAYHVGGENYTYQGKEFLIREQQGQRIRNLTPNWSLLGVELCVNEGGDWEKTISNAAVLCRHLLEKHKLSTFDLYRHYDITGKICPLPFVKEDESRGWKGRESWDFFRKQL